MRLAQVRVVKDISCGFEGANPLFILIWIISMLNGPVAQLVRAPPCHGGGREFESHLGRSEIYID